jgi:hypothetical protein
MKVIKSRRLPWVGHMDYIEKFRNAYDIIGEKSERKNSLGGLRHTGQNFERSMCSGSVWLRVSSS